MIDLDRVLVSLLIETSNMRKAFAEGVRSPMIVNPVERQIFNFQVDYWLNASRDKVATAEVLYDEFGYSVDEHVEESIEWVTERLKKRVFKNTVDTKLLGIAEANSVDSEEAVRMMFAAAQEVKNVTATRRNKLDIVSSIRERRDRYSKRATYDGTVKGAPLGYEMVDAHTFGILPGELAVVGGFAKTGKTMFLCNSAVSARLSGWTPYIATLEISPSDFVDRVDAMASGVSLKRLMRGQLDPDEIKTLHDAQDKLAEMGSMFIEKPSRGDRTVKAIMTRARELGADYVIIDQLSWMEPSKNLRSEQEIAKDIVPELVSNASDNEDDLMPVLLAAQLNRESKKSKDKIGMHNFAVSSVIEQTADLLLGMSRTDENKTMNDMQLDILGGRRVDSKSWLLEWVLDDKRTKIGEVRREIGTGLFGQ